MIRKAIYTNENEEKLLALGEEWNFHDAKTNEYLHGLHPYPAKFIPQIPRLAINKYTQEGDTVYDPFCGSGTTLVEASALKRRSVGTDNNSVAVLVSKVKTEIYTSDDVNDLRRFLQSFEAMLPSAKLRRDLVTEDKNFYYWFSTETIDHLSKIKGLILEVDENLRELLLSVFSSIIVKVSYQDSDTRYARKDKVITSDEVTRSFIGKVKKVIKEIDSSLGYCQLDSKVYQADSRNVSMIDGESVDLIVTSPPYLNAYDYHKYHRQRLHWLDADIKKVRTTEIGSHDQFTKKNAVAQPYFDDMAMCFSEWHRVLRFGGKCVIVIGDAIVSKSPVYVADTFCDILTRQGFSIVERSIRRLKPTNRSFNVKNSRMDSEHVLVLEKV
ncbi:DNA methyltransferase [Vibrio aestuarianus]|uniref:DNA methyltransferase n=1 Tax=Vibrio aestuarianus TaxID=28171 RepID=UPI00237D30A3|nr:DNA methyltransferase [Vibrio aestuarianus]MDE1333935.1 hypothetical protein [Vibrio aestuarianus]